MATDEQIAELARALSGTAGEVTALRSALCGLLSALRDVPGVREVVAERLERDTAAELGGSLNPFSTAIFEESRDVLLEALRVPPAG